MRARLIYRAAVFVLAVLHTTHRPSLIADRFQLAGLSVDYISGIGNRPSLQPSTMTDIDRKTEDINGAISAPSGIKVTAQQQVAKLRDANTKYKSLLKMAKERIEKQEEELKRLRGKTESASFVLQEHI